MISAAILVVCAFSGMAISLYMTSKYYTLQECETCESVVQSREAALFGIPNSLLGIVFYLLIYVVSVYRMLTGSWILLAPAFGAALAAVVFSLYLAWSLIFKMKRSCVLCFTSHVLNFVILLTLLMEMV